MANLQSGPPGHIQAMKAAAIAAKHHRAEVRFMQRQAAKQVGEGDRIAAAEAKRQRKAAKRIEVINRNIFA